MLASMKPARIFRGRAEGESVTYFSRPFPTTLAFAIWSRRYCVDLARFGTIIGNTRLLRLKEGWEEGTTIFVPTSRPKSLCGHSAHRPGVVARGIYLLRYVSTLKATLITNAKTMVLNTKESTEWAQTRFRIELLDTSTSAPWNEVPIMKEK
jgi:hypothetical protein